MRTTFLAGFIITAACLPSCGQQVAFVDLTAPPKTEMSVPVGKDYVSSLAASQQDRQYLSFTVRAGNDSQAILASAKCSDK
jgi:hypothetical protein